MKRHVVIDPRGYTGGTAPARTPEWPAGRLTPSYRDPHQVAAAYEANHRAAVRVNAGYSPPLVWGMR